MSIANLVIVGASLTLLVLFCAALRGSDRQPRLAKKSHKKNTDVLGAMCLLLPVLCMVTAAGCLELPPDRVLVMQDGITMNAWHLPLTRPSKAAAFMQVAGPHKTGDYWHGRAAVRVTPLSAPIFYAGRMEIGRDGAQWLSAQSFDPVEEEDFRIIEEGERDYYVYRVGTVTEFHYQDEEYQVDDISYTYNVIPSSTNAVGSLNSQGVAHRLSTLEYEKDPYNNPGTSLDPRDYYWCDTEPDPETGLHRCRRFADVWQDKSIFRCYRWGGTGIESMVPVWLDCPDGMGLPFELGPIEDGGE